MIAHRLIPEDRRALLHLEVSQFLRRPGFKDEFRYESAHLALRARLLGAPAEDPTDLVVLLSSAVAVELSSAMFETAKEMLDTIDGWFEAHSIADDIFDIIQRSGGCKVWLVTYPSLYLDYLDKHTDLCGFLSDFDGSARKVILLARHSRPINAESVSSCQRLCHSHSPPQTNYVSSQQISAE